jgi:hypothetical protein
VLLDLAESKELNSLSQKWKDRLRYASTKAKDNKGLTAMLVRPDGFVAWAAESEFELGAVEQSIKHSFGKPS